MIFAAVGAAGEGGRTTVNNRLKDAAAGAGRVRASMVGSGVMERTEGREGVVRLESWCDLAETPAISALSIAVEGAGPLDFAGLGKEF